MAPALASSTAAEALRELIGLVVAAGAACGGTGLHEALLRREEIMTTGLGGEVALPHAWDQDVVRPVVAVGCSRQGIPWNALDGRPVRLVFLLATPEEDPYLHLQALAAIARLARIERLKRQLLTLDAPAAIAAAIREEEAAP